jgi:hypothetical protein
MAMSRMAKFMTGLAVAGWLAFSAGALMLMSQGETVDAPVTVTSCPHEDSCSVDYHDGAWHVTRVVP